MRHEPQTLILLANLGLPRRPRGATARIGEPVLPDPGTASRQLAPLAGRPVSETDLPRVRQVQRTAVHAADAILAGRLPDCAALSALARDSTAHLELTDVGGVLQQRLVWDDRSLAAGLARRLAEELSILEPGRLRRCARAECGLLFYDTTRSRTRRWHAEDPCGWRERQRQHRARG
jgi:predicted RNA-binding Zn ribbon-like protein